jgi:prepilin-type N-terminal cleavage/methylation domain-containing protein
LMGGSLVDFSQIYAIRWISKLTCFHHSRSGFDTCVAMTYNLNARNGFTLLELAVVLIIMGIVSSMGLKMASIMLDNSATSETVVKQEKIKTALIGYLRTNGKLPCPEIAGSPTDADYGNENRVGGGGGGDGNCNIPGSSVPVVPWRILGLSRDDVVDGWGNFITYRVANNADTMNWASRTAGTPFTIDQLRAPTATGITVTDNGVVVSPSPVVVLVSHGKNGAGARTVRGAINAAPPGADEVINARQGGSPAYIRRPYTEDTSGGGAFDDMVAFMTPLDLLQPLASEGTVKSCRAYCGVSSCSIGGAACACDTGPGVAGTLALCTGTCSVCSVPVTGCQTGGALTLPVGHSPAICP